MYMQSKNYLIITAAFATTSISITTQMYSKTAAPMIAEFPLYTFSCRGV